MHLYFWIRGINDRAELFKTLMQSHFWQWTRKNLTTGKDEITLVQGSLRPTIWGAYEYIFPEDCLAEVLAVMQHVEEHPNWKMKIVRKFFNCERIPKEIWEEAKNIPVSVTVNGTKRGLFYCKVEGVAAEIIGIKRDHRAVWEEIGYEQEML